MTKVLIALLIAATLVILAQTGVIYNMSNQTRSFGSELAVCHATTEDSPILDCDYQNGAWYRK